ncbi:alkaline phosphatase D family protein [Patulibacter sp. SYSU D01012]|uniref:alkaline phosphatase D family protein n=1 Tax=Patulibacter sp. SYSU D01012 TaxID=2817381 RepID=UPI001B302A93|nr:alkaline phosphatase D family protein [Patulibacter sp. SYSU D01012]
MSTRISRRGLLAAGGAGAVALSFGGVFSSRASALPRGAYPFAAGVASGEPAPGGVVLWTRIALDDLGRQAVGGVVPVGWQIAEDEGMTRIVDRGIRLATAKDGYSVRVEADRLRPGREYWYRFYAHGQASPVGRTRTAPAFGRSPRSLSFCLASCSHWEAGHFTAYRRIVEDDPWLVVHVGDYIYEGGPGKSGVRQHSNAEPMDLAGYRERHAQYNSDPDLRELRRLFPLVVTPDDHEVENNYAGLISQVDTEPDQDPQVFAQRRAAAYQAYWEFMPLRRPQHPWGSGMQLYREVDLGDLAHFVVADTRQYRTDQPYGDKGPADGPEMTNPDATLPGIAQERWIVDRMTRSRARWNVLAQQVLMASHDTVKGDAKGYSTDQWDAYRASRQRVLTGIADGGTRNPVVLTGDIHQHYASDLLRDFADPSSPVIGSELCATSVTSGGDGSDAREDLSENPWMKYNAKRRGYVRVTVDRERLRADFRTLSAVTTPDAPAVTDASFTIEDGRPGLRA